MISYKIDAYGLTQKDYLCVSKLFNPSVHSALCTILDRSRRFNRVSGFYQKDREMIAGSGCSIASFKNAKATLIRLGLIEVQAQGRGANKKTFYRVIRKSIDILKSFVREHLYSGSPNKARIYELRDLFYSCIQSEPLYSAAANEIKSIAERDKFYTSIRSSGEDSLLLTPDPESRNNNYTQPSAQIELASTQIQEEETGVDCISNFPEPESEPKKEKESGAGVVCVRKGPESDLRMEQFEALWSRQEIIVRELAKNHPKNAYGRPHFDLELLPALKAALIVNLKASKISMEMISKPGRDVVAEVAFNVTDRISSGLKRDDVLDSQMRLLTRGFTTPYKYSVQLKNVWPKFPPKQKQPKPAIRTQSPCKSVGSILDGLMARMKMNG